MRRAVGIVRVSQVGRREGESFASPAEQRERIVAACERDGLELVETIDELDVSGGTPLDRRQGLRRAVEAVEAKEAEVVVAAYFDRLVRSLRVQAELVERVEKAGGQVLALDVGAVSEATAGQWVQGTMLGMMSEYYRRSAKERAGAAQARAIARGVPTFDQIPPGYRRSEAGPLVADDSASVVRRAFELRAGGAPIREVRDFLTSHGVERSYHGVQSMLTNRIYLGELRFGELFNPAAHEPLVEPEVFAAVQRVRATRGRRAKSDRLLARLGVLRCGTCGSRMVVGTVGPKGRYPMYRCPPTGDCPKRVTISAVIAEGVVVEAVLEKFGKARGRASAEKRAQQAAAKAEQAQAELDSAIRVLSGLEDEASARERLAELRAVRDEAVRQAAHLGDLHAARVIGLVDNWADLTLDEQRAVIRAGVERAEVSPGGVGAERITLVLRD